MNPRGVTLLNGQRLLLASALAASLALVPVASPAAEAPTAMPKVMLNTGHLAPVTQVLLSRDRSLLLSFSTDGAAKSWDVASRRQLCQLQDGKTRGAAVALSRSGRMAAIAGQDGAVRVWNPRACTLLGTLAAGASALQFSPTTACS